MAERSRSIPDVARYAHRRPDGSILYFESDGKRSNEGELPPDADPTELEAQGFTFLSGEAYERTRTALDPIVRAENADADELAMAFDASMGEESDMMPDDNEDKLQNLLDMRTGAAPTGVQQAGQSGGMNGMDPEMMAILQQYMQEGRLDELFQPFQQEQSVLDQQMQLAQGLRQRGTQRGTPTGALFGGLANAVGNIGGAVLQQKGLEGQTALGKRMQGDASGRVGAILREAMRRRGMDPNTGLMTPAVDDATLANIFAGG